MTKFKNTHLALALYLSWAVDAYGRTTYQFRNMSAAKAETMSFVAWVVLGLLAGFIGSKIVNRHGEGILLDVLLGVVGAFVGGWLFHLFGAPGVRGLDLYSLLVAVVGSVVFLVVYHALRPRRIW